MHIESYTFNMQKKHLARNLKNKIIEKLTRNPIVALLGPRQCGKSTLAKEIISKFPEAIYLDLERPSDLMKLQDPEAFFLENKNRLICLDEIQRSPDIFPLLRSIVDETNRNGQFLILGSASRDLLKQSTESLAGRITYLELTPFRINELPAKSTTDRNHWLKGGFPKSFLTKTDNESFEWRLDFIKTFLERDIPQMGFQITTKNIERFWTMCAHSHGQLFNASKLGASLGLTHPSTSRYLDILEQTFVIRTLPPYENNLKKRLVKSPKIYLRDTGILHALLRIEHTNDLFGHPIYGHSWEGRAIENIIVNYPQYQFSFYRTASGNELDLIVQKGEKTLAIECKASSAPTIEKTSINALSDLSIKNCLVIAPVKTPYQIRKNTWVMPLLDAVKNLESFF